MPDVKVQIIKEKVVPGHRLGRHVEHDPQSRAFMAGTAQILPEVRHLRHCPPFDQGDLGSCTGNAMAGVLMTEPYWQAGRTLVEADAVQLYEDATLLDKVKGAYPPEDTGSSGLAVAKAAVKKGYLTGYAHAFGKDHALGALTLRPVWIGINWYDSFDQPLPTGECTLSPNAGIRGGHEVEANGYVSGGSGQLWCVQSWGPTWGGLGDGTFWFSFATFERLLAEDGDVTFGRV